MIVFWDTLSSVSLPLPGPFPLIFIKYGQLIGLMAARRPPTGLYPAQLELLHLLYPRTVFGSPHSSPPAAVLFHNISIVYVIFISREAWCGPLSRVPHQRVTHPQPRAPWPACCLYFSTVGKYLCLFNTFVPLVGSSVLAHHYRSCALRRVYVCARVCVCVVRSWTSRTCCVPVCRSPPCLTCVRSTGV